MAWLWNTSFNVYHRSIQLYLALLCLSSYCMLTSSYKTAIERSQQGDRHNKACQGFVDFGLVPDTV